jgi:hypothetical protein
MIEFVLSLLLQFSVLQSDGARTATTVNGNKTATEAKATTTTTPTTDPGKGGGRIGSGGWDEKN